MESNYSLQLSKHIRETIQQDLSGIFAEYLPMEKLQEMKRENSRDRIFNDETTLLTMLLSATQEDKTSQNAVNIYSEIHKSNILKIRESVDLLAEEEKAKDNKKKKTAGRPKLYKPYIAKSKTEEISLNTGSYTTAKSRLSFEKIRMVYELSAEMEKVESRNKWKSMEVFIADGTYLQMQDTKDLRELYDVKSATGDYKSAYPQSLLQVLVAQGSGLIAQFELGNRHISELELVNRMLPKIKRGSLLLADDLYNSYAIFSMIKKYGLEIIVPGKRVRNYSVIKVLSNGDEIVEIKKTQHPNWLSKEEVLPESIIMRRIAFEDPMNPGKEYVIYTTITDMNIKGTEIVVKYFTRWDIEISIREIKVLMNINVIKSKTHDMIMKELLSALIAYNLIRKIISKSTENSAFSPEGDIIQKYIEIGKTVLMDKKGRIYNRWSQGRYGGADGKNNKIQNTVKERQTL